MAAAKVLKEVVIPCIRIVPADPSGQPHRLATTFYSSAGPSPLHSAVPSGCPNFESARTLHAAAFESLVAEAAGANIHLDPRSTLVAAAARAAAAASAEAAGHRSVLATFGREWALYRRHLLTAHGLTEEQELAGGDVEALQPDPARPGEFLGPGWGGAPDQALSLKWTVDRSLTFATLTSHRFWTRNVRKHFRDAGLELPHLGISARYPSAEWLPWVFWSDRHAARQRTDLKDLRKELEGKARFELARAQKEGKLAMKAYRHHRFVAAFAQHSKSVKEATAALDPLRMRTEAFKAVVDAGWKVFDNALVKELRDMLFRSDTFWQGKKRREDGKKWVDGRIDAWARLYTYSNSDLTRRLLSLKPSYGQTVRRERSFLQSSTAQAARAAVKANETFSDPEWVKSIMKRVREDFVKVDANEPLPPYRFESAPNSLGPEIQPPSDEDGGGKSVQGDERTYYNNLAVYSGSREKNIEKFNKLLPSVAPMDALETALRHQVYLVAQEWTSGWNLGSNLVSSGEGTNDIVKDAQGHVEQEVRVDSLKRKNVKEENIKLWWEQAAQICMHLISYKFLDRETRGRTPWSMSLFADATKRGDNIIETGCLHGLTWLLAHFSIVSPISSENDDPWGTTWVADVVKMSQVCEAHRVALQNIPSPILAMQTPRLFDYMTQGDESGPLWVGSRSISPAKPGSPPARRGKYKVSGFQMNPNATTCLSALSASLPPVTRFEDGQLTSSYEELVKRIASPHPSELSEEHPAVFRAICVFARASPRDFGLAGLWVGGGGTTSSHGLLHPAVYWLACVEYARGLLA
jgi:hypothetical protein